MKFVGGGVSRGPKEARSQGALPLVNTALGKRAEEVWWFFGGKFHTPFPPLASDQGGAMSTPPTRLRGCGTASTTAPEKKQKTSQGELWKLRDITKRTKGNNDTFSPIYNNFSCMVWKSNSKA